MYIAYCTKRVVILILVILETSQFFSYIIINDLETNISEDHYKGTHTLKS